MFHNIIIVNDNCSIKGGADAVAINSAVGLAKKGINVVFFAGADPISEKLIDAGVTVVCMNQKDILHDENRFRAIKKGIYNNDARKKFASLLSKYSAKDTIVHVHTWTKLLSSAVFDVAAMNGFKTVLTLHDFFTVCPNGGLYNYNTKKICLHNPMSLKCIFTNCDLRSYVHKLWRIIRQFVQNSKFNRIDNLYLLAVSQKVADLVGSYMQKRRTNIQILHNPIEILQTETLASSNRTKYLFMGRLAKEKGPDLFCETITQLGLNGVVVGDGYMRRELEAKYPNIEFAGWLSGNEKLNVIRECKCFVFTSKWYEAFGLVVAEMKALGIPAIVPSESAAAEQIEDGVDGLLYKIGDVDSLKEALQKFEEMSIKNMYDNTLRSFDESVYSIDSYINNLITIYSSLITNSI